MSMQPTRGGKAASSAAAGAGGSAHQVTTGAISKPRKLHRQVEQKRRMRISEQISELKQCISDANDGKTDKVSILKRTVSFVKEAQHRIHCLQHSLRQLQGEHARLLALVGGADANLLRAFRATAVGGCGCERCSSASLLKSGCCEGGLLAAPGAVHMAAHGQMVHHTGAPVGPYVQHQQYEQHQQAHGQTHVAPYAMTPAQARCVHPQRAVDSGKRK